MLISGEWIEKSERIEIKNPYTGKIVGSTSKASSEDIKQALKSAKNFRSKLSAYERSEILRKTAQSLQEQKDEFVLQIVDEAGVCKKEAHKEVQRAIGLLTVASEEAKRITGESIQTDFTSEKKQNLAVTIREPLGLVLAITPFNRPLNQVVMKLAPAIASNNTVLLKPSEKTPLSALKFVKLLINNGLPPQMVSVVVGDPREIGDTLCEAPEIDMVTFTGSQAVGEHIAKKVGMIKTTFELGDSGALIVMDDADLDLAASQAAVGAFSTSGQSCRGVKRILAHEKIADVLAQKIVALAKKVKVGDPYSDDSDLGAMISEKAAQCVYERVEKALASGAQLLFGERPRGAVYGPVVLDFVPRESELVTEETFGPIAPIVRIKNIEDAISYTNSTAFGLQTGLFTQRVGDFMRAARELDVGAVALNNGPQFDSPNIPFGGVKKSGLGREGIKYAIEEMTRIKTIVF